MGGGDKWRPYSRGQRHEGRVCFPHHAADHTFAERGTIGSFSQRGKQMKRLASFCAASFLALSNAAIGQDVPAEYQQVLTSLGKQGDYKSNVLKVNIPRNDLSVTVAGVKTPTPFGFGGWVAMTKGTGGGPQ